MTRLLIVTTVHDPDDARVRHRMLHTLRAAAIEITYAAPFTAFGRLPPPGVRALNLPRSAGRRRLGAWLAARRLLRREAAGHDLILLHDPELVLAVLLPGCPAARRQAVWDVQEDTAAAVAMRPWLPAGVGRLLPPAIKALERWADRSLTLILAEPSYQERFPSPHQVIRNCVPADDSGPADSGLGIDRPRVVYLGRLTRARGFDELIELGRTLADRADLELIGPADQELVAGLRAAVAAGWVTWSGFLANSEALRRLPGALAGVCLLHDQPNYNHSVPMKVLEYMAAAVPVLTTPNPASEELVRRAGCGAVVPFGSTPRARQVLLGWADDPVTARRLGAAGRQYVKIEYDWDEEGRRLTEFIVARAATSRRHPVKE